MVRDEVPGQAQNNTIESVDTIRSKCPSCGGELVYSPEDEQLICLYCGTKVPLDLTPVEIEEHDFDEWSKHPEMQDKAETLVAEVACGQCGAHTTFPENTTSYTCAFCGTPIVLKESVQRRSLKPEYMLPFKMGKKQCDDRFRKWVSSRWFAPSGFSRELSLQERMKGVYLPYWTYDADTVTVYEGARGVNRQVRGVSNGKTVTRTVTDWYPVSGTVHYVFDDVLVPASDSLPPDISQVLTNWDRKNYVAYNEQFMRGFLTELYRKDFRECYPQAKKQMESYISALVRSEIGGNQQRIRRQDTRYSDVKFKHVLLPVWLSAYRYKNKSYVFAVNGRTGQVFGQRPWSIPKIMLLILVLAAVLAVLFYFGGG
ncbi:MAG: TFIIB-type zinc ribbon-containing protein [Tannerella sp.]|jgi:ribosomal protein S27E|nr:TFIIB-type zinc ribbon-containing protein [Tannerella sp.]